LYRYYDFGSPMLMTNHRPTESTDLCSVSAASSGSVASRYF